MSFVWPSALFALLLIPALVLRYVGHQRDRHRAVERWVSAPLAAAVIRERPGRRRHLPALVLVLALVVFVLAAARPRLTVAESLQNAQIMLLTDISGSMLSSDVAPSRLMAARQAAKRFVANVPGTIRIGVMAFNQRPHLLQAPVSDHSAVNRALDALTVSGGTATGDAIHAATALLSAPTGANRAHPPAAIILLSDGSATSGSDPDAAAHEAARRGFPIFTVAVGTSAGTITVKRPGGGTQLESVPPDPRLLASIASAANGRSFTATDARGLNDVYTKLSAQVGRRQVKREVTPAAVGVGLGLLLVASTLSLAWFGRPL